jgi:hypothetical protein
MTKTKEQEVVRAALAWARAERALRQNQEDRNRAYQESDVTHCFCSGCDLCRPTATIVAACDRTEEELLSVAEELAKGL